MCSCFEFDVFVHKVFSKERPVTPIVLEGELAEILSFPLPLKIWE